MTTQIQILTILAAVLVAVERALSKGVLGPTLTGAWKAAIGALLGVAIAVANAVVGGDTWGAAIASAIAVLGPAAITALIQAISEWVEWRRSLRAPVPVARRSADSSIRPPPLDAAILLLVVGAFAAEGCGLFAPVAVSPCEGLYCVGVETAGIPGAELICYQTEVERETALADAAKQQCLVTVGATPRATCPRGVSLNRGSR